MSTPMAELFNQVTDCPWCRDVTPRVLPAGDCRFCRKCRRPIDTCSGLDVRGEPMDQEDRKIEEQTPRERAQVVAREIIDNFVSSTESEIVDLIEAEIVRFAKQSKGGG